MWHGQKRRHRDEEKDSSGKRDGRERGKEQEVHSRCYRYMMRDDRERQTYVCIDREAGQEAMVLHGTYFHG